MDSTLLFDSHIKEVCQKAFQKLAALSRLANYIEPEDKKLIFNSMIKSVYILSFSMDVLF